MNRLTRIPFFLWIVVAIIVGGLAANPAVSLVSLMQPRVWQSIPSPENGAAQIVTFTERDMIVRGTDDLLYACNPGEGKCRKIELGEAASSTHRCAGTHLDTPAPPQNTVDIAEFHFCGDDAIRQYSIAILADGHMREWDTYASAYDDFSVRLAQGFYCRMGRGVGLFISLAVLVNSDS